jgi:hypothetical protein
MDNAGFAPLQAHFKRRPSTAAAHRVLHHQTLPGVCSWKNREARVPQCRFAEFDEPIVDRVLSAGANIRNSSYFTPSALGDFLSGRQVRNIAAGSSIRDKLGVRKFARLRTNRNHFILNDSFAFLFGGLIPKAMRTAQ